MLVSDMIEEVVPELPKISKFDELSKSVCAKCMDIVKNALKLKRYSIENDTAQRSMLIDRKPIIENIKLEPQEEEVAVIESIAINCNAFWSEEEDERYDYDDEDDEYSSSNNKYSLKPLSVNIRKLSSNDYISRQEVTLKCDVCAQKGINKEFKARFKIEEHMLSQHLGKNTTKRKVYDCDKCLTSFLVYNDLKLHALYVHGKVNVKTSKPWKCSQCDRIFHSRKAMREHRKSEHALSTHRSKKIKKELKYDYSNETFLCHVCNKTFARRDSMLSHIRKTHEIFAGNMRCDMCFNKDGTIKIFRIKAMLEKHMMTEHLGIEQLKDTGYLQCDECKTTYTLFQDLQSHAFYVHNRVISEKPEQPRKRCPFCGETFATKHQLSVHYDDIHPDERKRFSCDQCSETFMREHKLETHKNRVHGDNIRKCSICDLNFPNKQDFILHKYMHCDYLAENRDPVKFECVLCSFNTYDQEELYSHLPYHIREFDQTEKVIVCINCTKIIDCYETLHSHTGDHNENVTHVCLKCNKKFVMGTKFLKHLMKHDDDLLFKCKFENCRFKTSEKYLLDAHTKHKHENIVFHLCQICGQSFSTRGSLKSHISSLHEDNKTFKCNLCPMTFRVASHLRNHQAVHSNEYTFKCDHPGCIKIFKAKRNLLRHKTFHDPSKLNYKHHCTYENCTKKFLKRDALNRHMLSHTKVKPYECNWEGCDRAFSQSNDLHKHLRQHYGHDRIHACKLCNESFRLKAELRLHEAIHYVN
ncbi:hypothetical protein PVAND_011062 [Polypedilum vanderplanki]|uniref:C2H2-type domain-containing protein n=1 Tax=Polypedilum vanderplanki TaxID=319348 RepID=A0A9J6CIF6_POLVA|nr:hypothetical protein PVAND_011062 [Polypedilum vanderplanki]